MFVDLFSDGCVKPEPRMHNASI